MISEARRPGVGRAGGFTLVELLTVMSIAAILLTLALPGMRGFMTSNKVASLSNEFTGALLQARSLAVSNNSCVSLCVSKNVSSSDTATCSLGSGADFQTGWIVFLNAACDATATDPRAGGNRVLSARRGEPNTGFTITPADNALAELMFDARGQGQLAAPGRFSILPPSTAPGDYRRTVCLDSAGRASVRKYTTSCS